jgi:cell division protein FtsZ
MNSFIQEAISRADGMKKEEKEYADLNPKLAAEKDLEETDFEPQKDEMTFLESYHEEKTSVKDARQENKSSLMDEVDAELQELLDKQIARIKVIGVGGGGNNTLNRIYEVGIKGAETIAVNTDAQDLLYTRAAKKILIGREITGGLGAGAQPRIGEEAAKENAVDLKKCLTKADLVFVTCGLGGGTGTGAAPIVAEIAKKSGALVVAVVTLPFAMEGQRR